jgi:hypothetical protein
MMARIGCVAVAVLLAGCGPTDFKTFCDYSASAICRATFRCAPDEARKVWPNIQDCTTAMSTRVDCGRADAERCYIPPGASSACIDDLDNMICAGTFVVPNSCDLTCQTR